MTDPTDTAGLKDRVDEWLRPGNAVVVSPDCVEKLVGLLRECREALDAKDRGKEELEQKLIQRQSELIDRNTELGQARHRIAELERLLKEDQDYRIRRCGDLMSKETAWARVEAAERAVETERENVRATWKRAQAAERERDEAIRNSNYWQALVRSYRHVESHGLDRDYWKHNAEQLKAERDEARAENERLRREYGQRRDALHKARQALRNYSQMAEGFADAVRQDSGHAYPWEPWQAAEMEVNAAMRAITDALTHHQPAVQGEGGADEQAQWERKMHIQTGGVEWPEDDAFYCSTCGEVMDKAATWADCGHERCHMAPANPDCCTRTRREAFEEAAEVAIKLGKSHDADFTDASRRRTEQIAAALRAKAQEKSDDQQ